MSTCVPAISLSLPNFCSLFPTFLAAPAHFLYQFEREPTFANFFLLFSFERVGYLLGEEDIRSSKVGGHELPADIFD